MTGYLRRSFAAIALSGAVAFAPLAPVYGQAAQNPTPAQQQTAQQNPTPESTRPLNIPNGPDYSKARPFFPHVFLPYTGMHMDAPQFTNSPRIEQLIQNG